MNWAFLGYGRIAVKFHDDLKLCQGQKVSLIASRSHAKALQQQYPEVMVTNDYRDLYANTDIDIVYISTTHNFHFEQTIQCLEAGHHVLCEKPMGLSYQQVEKMIDTSKRTGKFLMEGVWTQYLPAYQKMKELIARDVIGTPRFIQSDFSISFPKELDKRIYNPDLAGGGLYDLGVYNIALMNDLYKELPEEIKVKGSLAETGVDASVSATMHYSDDRVAQMFCSINTHSPVQAQINGTKGWLKMHQFYRCEKLEYQIEDGPIVEIDLPVTGNGYYHEIIEVMECVEKGKIESSTFSHQKSLNNARMVDQILSELKK